MGESRDSTIIYMTWSIACRSCVYGYGTANKLRVSYLKITMTAIMISALAYSFSANADCVNNQNGNVVCGNGQCEQDQYGKVFCAKPGGGAIKDLYANVLCGVGYCEKDILGQVWCSKVPGGSAAADSYGKVKCFGGCEAGTSDRCQEAK